MVMAYLGNIGRGVWSIQGMARVSSDLRKGGKSWELFVQKSSLHIHIRPTSILEYLEVGINHPQNQRSWEKENRKWIGKIRFGSWSLLWCLSLDWLRSLHRQMFIMGLVALKRQFALPAVRRVQLLGTGVPTRKSWKNHTRHVLPHLAVSTQDINTTPAGVILAQMEP